MDRKIAKQFVIGLANATMVATTLIVRSQWFAFEPLPNDIYEFTVNLENRYLLDDIITKAERKLEKT